MHSITGLSIKANNLKTFVECTGFESIAQINVVIGKNNSGKSALLDLLQFVTQTAEFNDRGTRRRIDSESAISTLVPTIDVAFEAQEPWIKSILADNENSNGDALEVLAANYCGHMFEYSLAGNKKISTPNLSTLPVPGQKRGQIDPSHYFTMALPQFRIARVNAERDIVPEPIGQTVVSADGSNATSLIGQLLNEDGRPRELISDILLRNLNSVLEPDCKFTAIFVRQMKNTAMWEINLQDGESRYVPLSQMGSGVKSVILTLLKLLVIPRLEGPFAPHRWVFLFEELENNLHPAVLRRLLKLVCDYVQQTSATLFLTTHSSITVDLMTQYSQSQILHVHRSADNSSRVQVVRSRSRSIEVLRDIGVRVSDILLTNAVVWLEGPSDRTLFNRWMSLFTDGMLTENVHYQCVFLGGSLSTCYQFDNAEEQQAEASDLIRALQLNHNSVVMLDSDMRASDTPLKTHVERIKVEGENSGAFIWITAGRELENYISADCLSAAFKRSIPKNSDPFASAFEHAASHGAPKSWAENKATYATRIAESMTRKMLHDCLDLEIQLKKVASLIAEWNGLSLCLETDFESGVETG